MTSNHDENQDIDFDPFSSEQPPTTFDYDAHRRRDQERVYDFVSELQDDAKFARLSRVLGRIRDLHRKTHGEVSDEALPIYDNMIESFCESIGRGEMYLIAMNTYGRK